MEIYYSTEKGLISYVIDGIITSVDMEELQVALGEMVANGSFKVLAIVTSFKGYESYAAMKRAIQGDLKMLPKLSKYALLTDSIWLRALLIILNQLVPKSKLKAFPLRDRRLAENWLD